MSLESKIKLATQQFNTLQSAYSTAVASRQRLDAQKSENTSVQKEFKTLLPGDNVYKLIGPVLLKQEQEEAKGNVEKRLEFIEGEIKRVEGQLEDLEKKMEEKKMELVHFQTQFQQERQSAAQELAGAGGKGKVGAIAV